MWEGVCVGGVTMLSLRESHVIPRQKPIPSALDSLFVDTSSLRSQLTFFKSIVD